MKKIFYQFWQILIFLPTFFMAQIQTYTKSMDSLMVNVNRSQMTTNTLYDKVYSFANLDQDALPVSPSYTYFVQSWNELYNAGYSPSFLSATALEQKAKTSIVLQRSRWG